jgi:hypothetical protein
LEVEAVAGLAVAGLAVAGLAIAEAKSAASTRGFDARRAPRPRARIPPSLCCLGRAVAERRALTPTTRPWPTPPP